MFGYIQNDKIVIKHNFGFFSNCNVTLHYIVQYINSHHNYPRILDTKNVFNWYKNEENKNNDITTVYFQHYNTVNTTIPLKPNISYNHNLQYVNYKYLPFKKLQPILQKYFSPSKNIQIIFNNIKKKYNLNFTNICVLFYRGNDKNSEIHKCSYNCYDEHIKSIIKKNKNIKLLVQSDETGFINYMTKKYPNRSFYFKDEIRHIDKCDSTVDKVMKEKNFEFSQYYLAITLIMSKCKYIICGTGNCSMWIALYKGNADNIFQNIQNTWFTPPIKSI
jgi:hypothetical protein